MKRKKIKKPWNGHRRISEKHGAELIKRAMDVFKKNNSYFWLDFGTLLGKVRDNAFIKHDGDVDLAVEYEMWNPQILKDLCDVGFRIRKPPNTFNNSKLLKFVGHQKMGAVTQVKLGYRYEVNHKIAGIKVCFEIYHRGVDEYKDMMYFWPASKPDWIFEMPRGYLVPQVKDTFYDTEIYIPKNYEENLNFMYGDNWDITNVTYTNSDEHKENAKKFKRFFYRKL